MTYCRIVCIVLFLHNSTTTGLALTGDAAMELPSGIVISSVSCTYSMLLFNLQFYTDKFDFFYHVYILVITGTNGDTYIQHKSFVHMP